MCTFIQRCIIFIWLFLFNAFISLYFTNEVTKISIYIFDLLRHSICWTFKWILAVITAKKRSTKPFRQCQEIKSDILSVEMCHKYCECKQNLSGILLLQTNSSFYVSVLSQYRHSSNLSLFVFHCLAGIYKNAKIWHKKGWNLPVPFLTRYIRRPCHLVYIIRIRIVTIVMWLKFTHWHNSLLTKPCNGQSFCCIYESIICFIRLEVFRTTCTSLMTFTKYYEAIVIDFNSIGHKCPHNTYYVSALLRPHSRFI